MLQRAAVASGALSCLLPIALSSSELQASADDAIDCIVNCNFRNQQLLHAEFQCLPDGQELPPKLKQRALDFDRVFCRGGLHQRLCEWCSNICSEGKIQQQSQPRDASFQVASFVLHDEAVSSSDDGDGNFAEDDQTPSVPLGIKQIGGTCYAFACVRSFNHRCCRFRSSTWTNCDNFAACVELASLKAREWLSLPKRFNGCLALLPSQLFHLQPAPGAFSSASRSYAATLNHSQMQMTSRHGPVVDLRYTSGRVSGCKLWSRMVRVVCLRR
jgi:hypothetical protein